FICRDGADRSKFAQLMGIAQRRFELRIVAWCVLGTHVHMVIDAPGTRISGAMHWLLGVYAQYFNRRHGRRGHLYQERFRAWIIRDEPHLREAIGYVYANPVRAGLCATLHEWPWSGPRPIPDDLLFASDTTAAPRRLSPGRGREKTASRAAEPRTRASERPSRRAASAGSRGRRTRTASRPRSPPC